MYMLWFVILGAFALAAGAAGWLVLAARRRYATLLAAVELCQRQLTELRTVLDEQRAAGAEVATLLRETVAPGVSRLERARSLAQAARELERSVERGDLEARGATGLIEELERLEVEVLAGERED